MLLGALRVESTTRPALVLGDHAYLIADLEATASSTGTLPASGDAASILRLTAANDALRALADTLATTVLHGDIQAHALTALGPPIARPRKVICVGRNYAEHARELGNELPERPILFAKFDTAIIGPFDDVVRPFEVNDLDYEAELCVVIGTGGRRIDTADALD